MTSRLPTPTRPAHWPGPLLATMLALLLLGCASPALREADQLALRGQQEQALAVLDAARREDPANHALQAAHQRQRELTLSTLSSQAELARVNGQFEATAEILARLEALDPRDSRVQNLRTELERARRHRQTLIEADAALAAGHGHEAEAMVRTVLMESPGLPAARALQHRINERRQTAIAPRPLAAVYNKKRMSLEYRDAALRNVFESIGRTQGINFVFDKDVKSDTRITVFLTDITLDDALRVILATQGLERRLLNENTIFIYPNTPAKLQEHQELVTRSFYLTNADVKSALVMVKTLAKTRDIYTDERLNLLVVRDTPEVMSLIERLIASIDLPEPEVMLEVEVMEIGSSRLNTLGIQWPTSISYGLPGATGSVLLSQSSQFRAAVTNPAVVAALQGTSGTTNLIANPKLRARNHEKAKVQIGERLPVFTSTAVANAGVATSVSYIETGLKLEVEPSVQLDNDVVMKVSLEVSTLLGQVSDGKGDVAYQVGTRNASTSLRLRDGETQILAGLINDTDKKAVSGLPGASEMPVLGRLFGVHTDTQDKTEVVLLITPRVVRNLGLPDVDILTGPAGNFANPGAESMRIQPGARMAMPMGLTGGRSARAPVGPDGATAVDTSAVLELTTTGKAAAGQTVSVTLQNRSAATLRGQMSIDAKLLQSAGQETGDRFDFELLPSGQRVVVLRVLPGADGKTTQIQLDGLTGLSANGDPVSVRVEGDAGLSFGPP